MDFIRKSANAKEVTDAVAEKFKIKAKVRLHSFDLKTLVTESEHP
jgi:hypothetical protein